MWGRAVSSEFERTMLPHMDAAYNLARWLVRDPTLAQDVAQDALLRALRFFPEWRGGSARAWLMRIVRNVAYDTLRDRGHDEGEEAMAELADPAPGPERQAVARIEMANVATALEAMPAPLRECLVLREIEGLSYKEIAEVAGVPIGTVMSRLWRARQALLEVGVA